jgi:hypothetical protein
VRPTSDKLYVLWTQPANPNIRVRSYILGWGKGIPDMYSQELDEKTRNYIIEKLEANSEYVLSLRASNERGTGPPVYTTVRTQDEPPPEPTPPLIPPVGLKAQILSATSVVLYWTDTTLSKSQVRILNQVKDRNIFLWSRFQYVRDSRYYVVKYTAEKLMKTRYLNITDLNVMIDDLKPNTVYEFSVKLVKGLFAIYVANLNINFKQIRPQRESLEHGCAEFDVGVGPECRPQRPRRAFKRGRAAVRRVDVATAKNYHRQNYRCEMIWKKCAQCWCFFLRLCDTVHG